MIVLTNLSWIHWLNGNSIFYNRGDNMGLPRILADQFRQMRKEYKGRDYLIGASFFSARFPKHFAKITSIPMKDEIDNCFYFLHCMAQYEFRLVAFGELHRVVRGEKKIQSVDVFERIPAKLYVGMGSNASRQSMRPEYLDVRVARFFLEKLEKLNASRLASDKVEIELMQRIDQFRSKIFASRNFPKTLRYIILNRDNHTCQHCGRQRDELFKLGLSLQVDHIVAFEDGGLTTYSNGETLCNECNIAKHHAKRYLRSVDALQSRSAQKR
jgi:hypothetical protein